MTRSLTALLLLAAAASAQEKVAPLPVSSAPFAGVFVAEPDADGVHQVRGERYKLCVAADHVTFQPLFGPKAPRDYPLQLRLVRCEVGGAPVALHAPATWQRDGERFWRDRGVLRECWRVAPGAAQQFFVVERPQTAGSLTLRLAVTSDLVAIDDGAGVRFVAPGLGDVHYSDAVIFDAAGQRLDVPVELTGDGLAITVPATFTANAQWPLVVDPFLTTVSIDTTVSDVKDAKVACEPTSGNWLVVAEEHLSATDVDIVCKRYDNSPTPVLLDTVYADNSTDLTHNPDVGFLAATQQFVIAWHNTATNGRFQWRTRNATSATMGVVLNSSSGVGGNLDNRPAIGSSFVSDRFLLVLFRKNSSGTDIFSQLLRNVGTNFGTLFLGPVLNPSAGTVVAGDVSPIASVNDKWVVVWRECATPTCTQLTIRMQAIATTGGAGPLVPEPTINLATGSLVDDPAIGGYGGKLLATWRCFDGATLSNDIHGVPIAINGGLYGPVGSVQNLSLQEPNVQNVRDQLSPAVSYDGVRFVYGYLEDNGNDTVLPHAATVFVSGAQIAWHEGHLPLGTVDTQTLDVAHGATANLGVHWAVWQQDSATFTGDVLGATIDARVPGPTSAITQTGCGLPVEPGIALTGTPALGRTFTVSLSNIPVLGLLLVGPESIQALLPCGACMAGVDLNAMTVFAASSLAVTVPIDPTLIQLRLAFQGMSGLQPGGCPTSFVGFQFALSDTLTIQVM
jgi:hypothetical protein